MTPSNTTLLAYLPHDRRQAMARGVALPDRATGAALLADISGFTALTSALTLDLGPRYGAEQVTQQLNTVYEALIDEIERFGGSVVGFAGDAIICWFDDTQALETGGLRLGVPSQASDAALRAVACGLAMQAAMRSFATVSLPGAATVRLRMKVAVACGTARRFVVGNRASYVCDVLAGEVMARVSAAEQVAEPGDVLVDEQTARTLAAGVRYATWRRDPHGAAQFAAIERLAADVAPAPWPELACGALSDGDLRPWLLDPIYASIQGGFGEFLTELRPIVALFLRFEGIDFEAPDAGRQLDSYVQHVQAIVQRYAGELLQITIDEKGSYVYAAFGAPIAHEDDARRAAAAALELRDPAVLPGCLVNVQIGLYHGMARVGSYGSRSRRTYAGQGDAVNLASRLMQKAAPGQILAGEAIARLTGGSFDWELLPPLAVKGKDRPVPVAQLLRAKMAQAELVAPAGQFVGRAAELGQLQRFVQPLFGGVSAGIVCIHGDAGMGKSWLVAELRRQLSQAPIRWLACPTDPIAQLPLHPFRYCLRQYFAQDPAGDARQNQARFDSGLDGLIAFVAAAGHAESGARISASELTRRLEQGRPFLAALVDLQRQGSRYEQAVPQQRFEQTLEAIVALLLAESLRQPLIIHVEDALELDAETRALILALGRAAGAYPIAQIVAGRNRDDGSPIVLGLDAGLPALSLHLRPLALDDIRALAQQVLHDKVGDDLAQMLLRKTGGNPFFAEQLALDLRDLHEPAARNGGPAIPWLQSPADERGEVPLNITSVLIARLDRLAMPLKLMVQAAAVLGPEFDLRVLEQLLAGTSALEEQLQQIEKHLIWVRLSDTRYRFRHDLLRSAAYAMQTRARLRVLHAQAGHVIETLYAPALAPYVPDLRYHFREAGDAARECRYVTLLGEQAYTISAFGEAIGCYEQALALVEQHPSLAALHGGLMARLGRTYAMLGDSATAEHFYTESLRLAQEAGDCVAIAKACYDLGGLLARRGNFQQALAYLQSCLEIFKHDGEQASIRRTLNLMGGIYIELGEQAEALACYQQALSLGRDALRERTWRN